MVAAACASLTLRRCAPRRSFSTALLCRERTMVINLEHVKARGRAARTAQAAPRHVLFPRGARALGLRDAP